MGKNHVYDKEDVISRLDLCLGKTFGEIDDKGIFDHVQQFDLQKGIVGHVVEQCIFEYSPNPDKEADLIIIEDGKETQTELKTTGLVIKTSPQKHYEAKEPMSITGVGIYDIDKQNFYSSHFWGKLEHMLIVYYYYAATHKKVKPYDYKDFPLKGYEFHYFMPDEKQTLKADWEIVRDFCAEIVSRHPGERTKKWKNEVKEDYIENHGCLRRQLSYIDLAPKYPPRFRLKQSTVSMLVSRHFGYKLEQLPGKYSTINDIDKKCHELTKKFKGKTVTELADLFDIPKTSLKGNETKSISELITVRMFGGKSNKLNKVEAFERFGLIAKTIVLTPQGGRTEDMKLYHMDFDELVQETITEDDGTVRKIEFSDSQMYSYFTNNELICIIFEEPEVARGASHKLVDNKFIGFKRLVFEDSFIEDAVQKLWIDTRSKIKERTLVDVVKYDNNGNPIVNKSGGISSAPSFMKSKDNTVFLRGSGKDSSPSSKTEKINGIKMLPQYVWIKGSSIVKELEKTPFL